MNNKSKAVLLSVLLGAAYGCDSDPKLGPPMDTDMPPVEGDMIGPDGAVIPMPPGEEPGDEPGDEPTTPGEDGGVGTDDGGLPETAAWYKCQSSDQTFVRNALLGVLGRRPYSQAEVNVYTDLIKQVDIEDGTTPAERDTKPGAKLAHSRQVMLQALFATDEYRKYWGESYRDFIRVQRVDEYFARGCHETFAATNPITAAKYVRDIPADAPVVGSATMSMRDVVEGSIALDDVTPIYTANLFAMMAETYAGANATDVALELTRRADFGAWFDEVYLHRDAVCLNCHNSEFSVTETDDPKTNRHYPLPGLLEKSLFGESTGPATFGGFEGPDRLHAPLKYKHFVNDCAAATSTQAAANTAGTKFKACPTTTEGLHRCGNSELICDSVYLARRNRPWGMVAACGQFTARQDVESDIAGVEAKFGNITGLQTSPWDLADSLRAGFNKLAAEGLKPEADGTIADPDKAFAYLVSMRIVEKAWVQIVGTPLTIPTRFPRNAAARDQLQVLTDAFVASGYSNKTLLETIFASPYLNIASPKTGCGEAYAMPALFDPWVIADNDPVKKRNAATDAIVSLPSRTATNALYAALEWTAPSWAMFPDLAGVTPNTNPLRPIITAERQFQNEVGFYMKNAEPGFRGFDFQARLGWESRFGSCSKFAGVEGPDYIDKLAATVGVPDRGTVRDVVVALKDRMIGRASITDAERPVLEKLLGASLDADANSLVDPAASLRKVCGVLVSSPHFLLVGVTPKDATTIPKLTPVSTGYAAVCAKVAAALPPTLRVTCNGDSPLSLNGLTLTSL